MSKVKQPIDEAREFAEQAEPEPPAPVNATPPPENQDQQTVDPVQAYKDKQQETFIRDSEGAELAYASEQERMNFHLRDAVIHSERHSVEVFSQMHGRVKVLKEETEQLRPERQKRIADFHTVFSLPPENIAPKEQVHQDASLQYPVEDVKRFVEKFDEIQPLAENGMGLLEELSHHLRPTRLEEAKGKASFLCEELLKDTRLTEEVLLPLRGLSHTDVFMVLRNALQAKGREVETLRAQMTAVQNEKTDAIAMDDVVTVERCSFDELDLQEKILERLRERLQEVAYADEDVRNFCQNFADVKEKADYILNDRTNDNTEAFDQIKADIDTLTGIHEEKVAEDAQAQAHHHKEVDDSNYKLAEIQREQNENWEQIMALINRNTELAREREQETNRQLESHIVEAKRHAAADNYIVGLLEYLEGLQRAKDMITQGRDWITSIGRYVAKLSTQIENNNVDENAVEIRLQEQMDYLDAYRQFKQLSDDMRHRKEVRIMGLGRVSRNLELQAKEASTVLDPNKLKYEAELEASQNKLATAKEQLASIKDRIELQAKFWQPVEDQLEDAGVEFTPPDIEAERNLVEKKTQSLTVARDFVNTEQESIDKDTMGLRKLKTANQVAIEGVSKRRAGRDQDATVAGGESPPKQVEGSPEAPPATAADSEQAASQ